MEHGERFADWAKRCARFKQLNSVKQAEAFARGHVTVVAPSGGDSPGRKRPSSPLRNGDCGSPKNACSGTSYTWSFQQQQLQPQQQQQQHEAEQKLLHQHHELQPPKQPTDGPSSPFSSLSRPQLSAFKRTIETGNLQEFLKLVEENPRYLINCSADTPTIVHEGQRYNSLHIATRCGQVAIVRTLLELVDDADNKLLQRLYPGDSAATNDARRTYLVDCFLNTPDKVVNETPLHFASKFGSVEIVKSLVAYESCNKGARNRQGETAADVACAKIYDQPESELASLKNEILALLSEVYVPLYRPVDNSGTAVLMPPVSDFPAARCGSTSSRFAAMNINDDENRAHSHMATTPPGTPPRAVRPSMRLAAVAGPFLSPENAMDFYSEWSSPKYERHMKRADLDKGYERCGRTLAQSKGIPFSEL